MRPGLKPSKFLESRGWTVSDALKFEFLNVTHPSPFVVVDWSAEGMSRLWRYNLHYFDYLLGDRLSDARKSLLIDDWIERNPPGTPDAWDPYPMSLRIVNWVKFFLGTAERDALSQQWLDSLALQGRWLEQNFEYHLLANHLLKNAVALFHVGAFLNGAEADRWLARGWGHLQKELSEQFLGDGGHYERSPMYHSICLADCYDVLALCLQNPDVVHVDSLELLRVVVLRGAEFLRDVSFPDGEIALFNDSAFRIAPMPADLLSRVNSLLGASACGPATIESGTACELIERRASGYFGLRHGADMLLVDCGEVGPDYQPGHAHCDTLSYELALDGQRLVVDTGVYDYEAGERRQLARGTASHNTVVVDGQEQSEIWGVFRVARRARPQEVMLHREGAGAVFQGAHDGYRRLRGRPIHRRRILYDGAGSYEIQDEVTGSGEHTVESRIHLHPSYRAVIQGMYAVVSNGDGHPSARIEFLEGARPQLEQGRYFPQFGIEQSSQVLVLKKNGPLPLRLGYRIVKGA